MAKATIRSFDWNKDIKEAIRIIYDVWFFDIEDPIVGHTISNYFLLHYLRNSTVLRSAVDENDKLIGLLGLTDKRSKPQLSESKWVSFKAAMYEALSFIGMYVLPGSQTPRLFDGLFIANYRKLRKMVPCPDAPEFLVLIADPKARGMGVGKALMNEGENYLREHGFNKYYLLTDSSCDYGFYDKIGMERVVDVSMSFCINHVKNYDHYLNCYLRGMVYVKDLHKATKQ